VVEPSFGERLAALPADEPVWIVESPRNTPVAKRLWRERPASIHVTGITTFRPGVSDTPEARLLSILGSIDLHHGGYSADPPYSVLEVIGCQPSANIAAALEELEFRVVQQSSDCFTAVRNTHHVPD
jgi:hypothetical protein